MKAKRTVRTRIKRLVARMGYKEVAFRLDVALSYVYRLEKGTIPGSRLYRDIIELEDVFINSLP